MKLINTLHLFCVFIANSLTETFIIRLDFIEAKIALKLFVITSKEKHIDCITFPELSMDPLTKKQWKKYKKATKCHICY